jgi:hypothetical protein
VTIIAKPRTMQLPAGDHYLMTRQRWDLEALVASGQIELLRSKTENNLLAVDGQLHSHVLEIENTGNGATQSLYFYEKGRSRDNAVNNWQGAINTATFKADWSASVDTGFFETMREQHLDEWFSTLGRNTQMLRENNRVTNLVVTKDTLSVDYNTQTICDTPAVTVPFAAKLRTAATSLAYSYRYKDLAPVFYNLAGVAATSAINIQGNADTMLITFNTNVAAYTVALPTQCAAVPFNTIFKKAL